MQFTKSQNEAKPPVSVLKQFKEMIAKTVEIAPFPIYEFKTPFREKKKKLLVRSLSK